MEERKGVQQQLGELRAEHARLLELGQARAAQREQVLLAFVSSDSPVFFTIVTVHP
jgi:hypothetical protein